VVSFESIEVSYSSRNASNKRTAIITTEMLSEDDLDKLDRFLSAACKEGGIIYIRGL
jgi:hypothetical protein